ncbi:MAG: OmpA family protein [Chitinispirillaceae bacterium]|nr:OmpA family protein [Chitinispirillaceae bacterium]
MNKRAVFVSGVSAILLLGIPAWATFNTSGHKGIVRTLNAKTYGRAKVNIGAGLHFGQANDYLNNVLKNENGIYVPVDTDDPARLLSSNLVFTISPLSFWDIGANMPFYYDWSGISGFTDGGLGDMEISTKLAPRITKRFYYQGYYLGVTVPIGMKNNGLFPRHPYYLEDQPVNPSKSFYSLNSAALKGLVLFTFDFGDLTPKFPLQVHINAGGVITMTKEKQRNSVITSMGLELTPAQFIALFADLHGESRWQKLSDLDPRSDPIYISPGFRINAPAGLYLQFAGDFSLSSHSVSYYHWDRKGYRYDTEVIPRYGFQFLFGWNGFITIQDDDHDGSKNDVDRCPKDAEDEDGFEDEDGCPDLDNDKDNLPDLKDKCPNEAEDIDGFEDEDGCPDPDNDADGIADLKDQCPNIAEDFDGFEDNDGCVDPDNDKDGVPDSVDKCPNDVEDFDSFEDKDGCPDLDNDKDNIPDLKDKCPEEPESFNNIDDEDGCPDSVKKEPDMPKQQLLRGINFKSGKAEMTYESYQFLEPLLKQLRKYPEVVIEVRGHSDSVGSYSKNMKLSQERAESVRQYLISKGIESDRVRAAGFGSSSPIADNRTAAGRAQNRRIEIVRIK